jgi:hypothetical protein
MADTKTTIKTLADVLAVAEAADLPPYQLRDMRSAIKRVTVMVGMVPANVEANTPTLRTHVEGSATRGARHHRGNLGYS